MEMPIPGSEYFDNPVNPVKVTLERMSPDLKLHMVSDETLTQIDPATYEVLRHRFWSITHEMGETMKKMSGSIVVSEVNDFDTAILDEVGDVTYLGLYNADQGASMDMAVKWTLENRSKNPGIEEGDIFFTNDPWVGGGLHQNDVCVFAPLFWEGELFCWTTVVCHEMDVGGVSPGSLTPFSRSAFWEAAITPPMKLACKGKILRDVEEAFLRRSRGPALVALDLRSQIGAINIGQEQIRAQIRKYGADTVKAVMKLIMNKVEETLRAKLKRLPDGTWSSFTYQDQAREGDRGIYKIALKMTKKEDLLTFDFRGTDPQMEGPKNCAYSGLRGGILGGLLPILCGDMTWSPGGVFRCIKIISEKGTVNNALFPAAVGKASWASTEATGTAVLDCLSKMLNTTPEYRKSVWARSAGSFQLLFFAGMDVRFSPPIPFIHGSTDSMASGYGARSDQDGVDTGGLHSIPTGVIPDVEMIEYKFPLLYLWRKEEPDSGGPGKYRGGLAGSSCLVAHRSTPTLQIITSGAGMGVSMNSGLNGGYPGSTALDLALRETNVWEILSKGRVPASFDEIQYQQKEILHGEQTSVLGSKDVIFQIWHGGSGYMDPLLRDPRQVLKDVCEEKVLIETAQKIYGVVVDPDTLELDEHKTQKTRSEILKKRASRTIKPDLPSQSSQNVIEVSSAVADVKEIDENVVITENGQRLLRCSHCGFSIANGDQSYTDHLVLYEGDVTEAGPQIFPDLNYFIDAKSVFRQFYCPGCHIAFITQVVPVVG